MRKRRNRTRRGGAEDDRDSSGGQGGRRGEWDRSHHGAAVRETCHLGTSSAGVAGGDPDPEDAPEPEPRHRLGRVRAAAH